jgi:hypothetical protein
MAAKPLMDVRSLLDLMNLTLLMDLIDGFDVI